jgi:putative FmdB family regulatory protein
MPIYEYQCQSCQHEFEALQKINDAALIDCPECQESALKKKISAAGFRLAGSGWYETDFKKSGNKKNLAGDGNSSDSGKSADKGKAETKGEAGKSSGKSDTSKSSSASASTD